MALLCLILVLGLHSVLGDSIFNTFPEAQVPITSELGLDDRELSLQFTLSYLSFLTADEWLDQYELRTNKEQVSVASVRYQLAFMYYSTPLLCYRTPAYRGLCQQIMTNFIDRMVSNKTWANEIDVFWGPDSYKLSSGSCSKPLDKDDEWQETDVYPDPVAYQNIMYSGHLAQMVTLFETVFNNDTYSKDGWYFRYNDTAEPIFYNTTMLLDVLAAMQNDPRNTVGGIACEPFRVFTECNQHQNIAFNLYNNAIKYNEDYDKAKNKWVDFWTTTGVYNDTIYTNGSLQFQGWVKGIYYQDIAAYFQDNVIEEDWNYKHLECGWDDMAYTSPRGKFVSIPNSPPRDTWVSSMSYLYLEDDMVNDFICNDALIKLYDNRLWKYDTTYDAYVLNNHVRMGICWGTSMYTMSAKQCLHYNEQKGYNTTAISERIESAQKYLIDKYGALIDNPYNLNAPYLDVGRCDSGFGSSLIDTGNLISGLALYNDSWRVIHHETWPQLQTTIELLEVDYPTIMVRYANVESEGHMKFEVFVSSPLNINNEPSTQTQFIVKLDNDLVQVLQDGNKMPSHDLHVEDNILTITAQIKASTSSVFDVYTTSSSSV